MKEANGQHKTYAVLYVDDEPKALHYFLEAFQDQFPVYTAGSAAAAYSLLQQRSSEIGVLITDQRMPGEKGVELLEKARQLNPNLVRILVTAYTDYQAAVSAVNEGRVFRYIHKPWDPDELSEVLNRAMDYYKGLMEREDLLRMKMEAIRQMQMADKVAGMSILAEGLNHHLRNALTAIRAFVDLAPAKLADELEGRTEKDGTFWREFQQHAQGQLDRIYTLLSHIGQASQPRRLVRDQEVSVSDEITSVFSLYDQVFSDKHVAVFLDIDPSTPQLRVNGERFRQLWRLLFTEALTHLSAADELVISVVPAQDRAGHDIVRITVSDTGEWPADEHYANLFDPFFARSRKPDDFGVRMMACYIIVHLHGGTIEASRGTLNGVEINMEFPVTESAVQATRDMSHFFARLMEHEKRWSERELASMGV